MDSFAATSQVRLCRLVPEEEYRAFAGAWEGAMAAMQDRAACMDAVAETLEAGLTLLGATAIEDQLQQVLCFAAAPSSCFQGQRTQEGVVCLLVAATVLMMAQQLHASV